MRSSTSDLRTARKHTKGKTEIIEYIFSTVSREEKEEDCEGKDPEIRRINGLEKLGQEATLWYIRNCERFRVGACESWRLADVEESTGEVPVYKGDFGGYL